MADLIKTWGDKIRVYKNAESNLIVDTESKVGGWNLWKDIQAFCLRQIEIIWANKILAYKSKIAVRMFWQKTDYRDIALAFQYGKSVAFLGDRFGYVVPDSTLEVVDACMIMEKAVGTQNGLYVHPGKLDVNGDLQPLSTLEQAEFELYFEQMKQCGRRMEYIDTIVGNLIIQVEIFYDPLKFNADGSSFDDASIFPVVDAILGYQNEFVNVTGHLNQSELRKRLYAIDGVGDLLYTRQRWATLGVTTYVNHTAFGDIEIDKLAQYNKAGTPEITYTSL